jgi:hypothetical protein
MYEQGLPNLLSEILGIRENIQWKRSNMWIYRIYYPS